MLRNNRLHPAPNVLVTSSREEKIYWNAPLTGPHFQQDQLHVWTYLAERCLETSDWSHIQRYQATSNSRLAWLALSLFYGGRAENTRKIVVTRATLEQLSWSNEGTFKFNDYATQLINHLDTLERAG